MTTVQAQTLERSLEVQAALSALISAKIPLGVVDANGDLIVGVDENVVARLPMGTALQVLRVNAAANGLEWATGPTSALPFIAHGNTGASETIDPNAAAVHTATQDMSCTYTFTPPADALHEYGFTLYLLGITGTATWPASVKWPDGIVPAISGRTVLTFTTIDGGTIWQGFVAGKAFA